MNMTNDGDVPRPANDDFDQVNPWSIYFPSLSESRARAILRLVEEHGLSMGGEISDPKEAFWLQTDRVGAEWLRAALSDDQTVVHSRSFDSDALETVSPEEAREGMEAIVDDLDDFLEYSRHTSLPDSA